MGFKQKKVQPKHKGFKPLSSKGLSHGRKGTVQTRPITRSSKPLSKGLSKNRAITPGLKKKKK
jgi:hypothetical protein